MAVAIIGPSMSGDGAFQVVGSYASGGGGPVLTFQAAPAGTNPNATSTTFTSVAIGTATSDRIVIVVVQSETSVVTGVTVGGVSATKAVEESTIISGLQIWYAAVPSGTTANIVLSAGGTLNNTGIVVYSATGITAAPTQTKTVVNNTGASPTNLASLTIPATGFGVAAYAIASTASSIAFTNATSDAATAMTNGDQIGAAHATVTAAIGITWSGPANNHMVAAAWGP